MRMMVLLSMLAIGCAGPRPSRMNWGVTTMCRTPRSTVGSFSRVLTAHDVLVVYPDVEQKIAALFMKKLRAEGRRATELRPGDRERNLVVLGTIRNNPLVRQLNGALPVFFEHGRFTFGGYRYDEPSDGLTLIHPNPFKKDHFVLLYVGNADDGFQLTLSGSTEDYQFTTFGLPGGIEEEGDLCDDGARWKFYRTFSTDHRRPWEAYRARLERHETPHNVLYWLPGSPAARDGARLLAEVEADHRHILDVLGVAEPDGKIATYYYDDRVTKARLTGNDINGSSLLGTVNILYTDTLKASGPHEYVHAIATAKIGLAINPLIAEGLAVMVSDSWNDESLEQAVASRRKRGALASLAKLVTEFRTLNDDITYPEAGHFVKFLVARYGIDKVKALYVADDLTTAFQQALHVSQDQLEADWLATIPQ